MLEVLAVGGDAPRPVRECATHPRAQSTRYARTFTYDGKQMSWVVRHDLAACSAHAPKAAVELRSAALCGCGSKDDGDRGGVEHQIIDRGSFHLAESKVPVNRHVQCAETRKSRRWSPCLPGGCVVVRAVWCGVIRGGR